MKSINITPEVVKLLTKFKNQGIRESTLALDKVNDGRLQAFQEAQTSVFWIEGDAPKWVVKHVITRLEKEKKLTYRDKKEETPIKKIVNKILNKDDEELHLASPLDLKEYVKKYMKGYKMSPEFKKGELKIGTDESSRFFEEIRVAYTAGIQEMQKAIFEGKKENYRDRNRMDAEKRALYDERCREEYDWLLENLIWLAKPSKKYIDEHKKLTTNTYQKVAADLSACVNNSLYQHRSLSIF